MSFIRRMTQKARHVGDVLKDEYAKGKAGDDSPVQHLGPTATDVLKRWLTAEAAEPSTDDRPEDAGEVAGIMHGVDWKQVSTSMKESQTAARMKDLAAQVDWAKAKPAAARVGTALIAAAASGQLGGLKGRTGAMVARTILDQSGLAERVSGMVAKDSSTPLGQYIDTTASDVTEHPFETNLGDLRKALGPAPAEDGA